MLSTLPFLLVTLGVAIVALYQARRLRGGVPSRPVVSRATDTPTGTRVPALLRVGRIGIEAHGRATRCTARVAPADQPNSAIIVYAANGTVLADVPTADLVMARAFTSGRCAVSFGEARREFGQTWPLGPEVAGWEVHLVDVSGTITRCYGMPGSQLDLDVERLRRRIEQALLAEAS
ncbi:MAG TPA: hypothetical protein VFH38_00750 [Jatrophihabitans sp.]|nr:hypothetical protein [Jatrophihabitans sp.]